MSIKKVNVVAFEPDLLFSSKIENAARKIGVAVTLVCSFEELQTLEVGSHHVFLVSLDFLQGQLKAFEKVVRDKSCKLVGYYSHVNSQLAEEARRMGFQRVISRGAFAKNLESILEELTQ